MIQIKNYYKTTYSENSKEIFNSILNEIYTNNSRFSSFFIIYLSQLNVISKEELPQNHYFFDEELSDYS